MFEASWQTAAIAGAISAFAGGIVGYKISQGLRYFDVGTNLAFLSYTKDIYVG